MKCSEEAGCNGRDAVALHYGRRLGRRATEGRRVRCCEELGGASGLVAAMLGVWRKYLFVCGAKDRVPIAFRVPRNLHLPRLATYRAVFDIRLAIAPAFIDT